MKKGTFTAEKIWDIRYPPPHREVHPDLIRYKDAFYCQFQELSGNHIIRSRDGREWETVQLGRVGFMFSITPNNELMMNGTRTQQPPQKADGSWHWQTYTNFSSNGDQWELPCVFEAGWETVMFRVTWHDGVGYSVGYGHKDATGTLYRTHDGRDWQVVTQDFFPPGRECNEADLAFEEDGSAHCLVRGVFKSPVTVGFCQDPEYREWRWAVPQIDWFRDGRLVSADEAIRAPFGAPRFLRLSDGRLLAYGRVLGPDRGPESKVPRKLRAGGDSTDPLKRDEHASVTLMEFDPQRNVLTRVADFPGYSHYHGIVEHDGQLWIACGSADSFSEVWLLKVPLDALPFPCKLRE